MAVKIEIEKEDINHVPYIASEPVIRPNEPLILGAEPNQVEIAMNGSFLTIRLPDTDPVKSPYRLTHGCQTDPDFTPSEQYQRGYRTSLLHLPTDESTTILKFDSPDGYDTEIKARWEVKKFPYDL